MQNTLLQLLKLESKEIQLSFEKASIEGAGTPQEVSDRRESAIVKIFLEKYFPFPYRIIKGNIIDSYDKRSNSIDCIILNPSHPYTIDPKNEKASIILADGVDCAIEIKPELNNKIEIERSLMQIRSVRKLRRQRTGLFFESQYNDEQIEYAKRIPTFIFANNPHVNINFLIDTIINYYISNNVPLIEQFDFIILNNRAIIFNSRENSHFQMSIKGIVYAETNENTIAAFLIWLNRIPKSEATIGPNVLSFYLDDNIYLKSLKTIPILNEKLNSFFKIS